MCKIIGCYHNRVEHASMLQGCCKKAHLMLQPVSNLCLILVLTRIVFGKVNQQIYKLSFTVAVLHKLGQYGGNVSVQIISCSLFHYF